MFRKKEEIKRYIKKIKFKLFFAWFDLWIGVYIDVGHKTVYINFLPTLVLRIEFPGEKDGAKHRKDRDF